MKNWLEQSPITVGVGLVVAGFVLIFLAWNGAAGRDAVEAQFPYVISGGLTGIALIGAGLTVILVQTRRADSKELSSRLDDLTDAVRAMSQANGSRPAPAKATATQARKAKPATAKAKPKAKAKSKAKAAGRTRSR